MIRPSCGVRACACLLLLSVPSTQAALGKNWHVAQSELPGIDQESQLRTIGEAVAIVEPGDTVTIHGGIYRESVVIERSGLADKPITIQAAPGAHVVVTGADRITDWRKEEGDGSVFSMAWPYKFATHPDNDFHRVIGRCEQVFVGGYALRQVLSRDALSRGAFFVDTDAQRLYAWAADSRDLSHKKTKVEVSVRKEIWLSHGKYVHLKGIRFRYAANRAQRAAIQFRGDYSVIENCVFEHMNASGARFSAGQHMIVRNCVFQHNGQMGFGVGEAHHLLITGCVVRNNNTKGYNRNWEAGGSKIVLARGVVIESSVFVENRGHGIWFDIGNEDNEVRNCLIANNEDAGIFYEISYGLHAHDNVIVGNGLADNADQWGANAGISISSSPNCVIERNLIVGNKEGFAFREQIRSTPRIGGGWENKEPVYNHDEIMRNNVIAYNRDAQTWGWFDVPDNRHWPARDGKAADGGLTLEKLSIAFSNNIYTTGPGQALYKWSPPRKGCKEYRLLDDVRSALDLEQGSRRLAECGFQDFSSLDFRVPADSPLLKMDCYPKGNVPGVLLSAVQPK